MAVITPLVFTPLVVLFLPRVASALSSVWQTLQNASARLAVVGRQEKAAPLVGRNDMKLKPILTLGTFVVFAADMLNSALADPASKDNKMPRDQAIESVDKNVQNNPENPGPRYANERLPSN